MRRSLVPPVLAFAVAVGVLVLAASAGGHDPLQTSTWSRTDSGHYEAIARSGYRLSRCPGKGWCGNTAWLPGYPLLLAALGTVGVPIELAGIAVAWTAAFVALLLLWRWYLVDRPNAYAALAVAAFAPGFVYLYAIFPLSLLCVFGIVFAYALARRRYLVAGLAGAAAAVTYPVGAVAVPLIAAAYALRVRRLRVAIVVGGPALVGLAMVALAQRLQTGRWTAYFDEASTYRGGLHNPLAAIWGYVRDIERSTNPFRYTLAPAWQVLLVSVLMVGAIVGVARPRERDGEVLIAWCVIVWILPLTQANQSVYRTEAALLLLAPLALRWPRVATSAAAIALAVLGFTLARVFFDNGLPG